MFKGVAGLLTMSVLLFLIIGGWFLNIYKLTQLDFEAPYKAEIIRAVGIPVAVVGIIGGWMDIGEENKE